MTAANLSPEALAGVLDACPGGALPTLSSTRQEWAPRLARGQAAEALPGLLASLYTLCGGAHRLAARLAVAAARGQELIPAAEDRQLLRGDTLREHLRRMWLDWPRAWPLPGPAADVSALGRCPVLRDASAVDDSRPWIESQVLGMPVQDWLQGWAADPRGFAQRWCEQAQTLPARWLQSVRPQAMEILARPVPLALHVSRRELEHLAEHLRGDDGFALRPLWRGHIAETGPWTRLADRPGEGRECPYVNAFMRLASRVADVARLAAPEGSRWLSLGAVATAPGEGMAWCEMARGLLIHWVRVEPLPAVPDAPCRVADCRVLAPTEWNFHPFGVVARLLAAMPCSTSESRVHLLAAAFDPCVALRVQRCAPREMEGACTR